MTKECECAAYGEYECVCGAWDEPQRTWVGLTDEEINEEASKEEQAYGFVQGVLWAEAKLKEKNT